MGLLVINDNLLTALGITNEDQFNQTFSDFSDFEDFLEKADYTYKFDEDSNLILVTPKSKEINTEIKIQREEPVPTPDSTTYNYKIYMDEGFNNPNAYKIVSDDSNFWYNTDGTDNYKKYNSETIILDANTVLQILQKKGDKVTLNMTPLNENYVLINPYLREVQDLMSATRYMPTAQLPYIKVENILDPTDTLYFQSTDQTEEDIISANYWLVDENNQPVERYHEFLSSDSLEFREVGTLHGTFTGESKHYTGIYTFNTNGPFTGINVSCKCSVTFP